MTSSAPLANMESIGQEFEAIDVYLKTAREVLDNGHMPDLAGLNERVKGLCFIIESADPEIQAQCIARLNRLVTDLNGCEKMMTEMFNHKSTSTMNE